MPLKVSTENSNIRDFSALTNKLDKIKSIGVPSFAVYNLDINTIKQSCKPFMKYNNIIVIGNGGSVSSGAAIYESVGKFLGKNVVFLTTMEPDYLNYLKKNCKKSDTVVIPISKSGTTIGQIESLLYFLNDGYPALVVTNTKNGALLEIAKKKRLPVIEHPDVGGRFSGRTSCAMVPAELMGVNISEFNKGFLSIYKKCGPDKDVDANPALKLACVLYTLEQQGKVDVFMPVYSVKLAGFVPLIVQLMHESFGKEGKGQTYFGGLSPETQHHTNQRFFGGRQNIAGLFMKAEKQADGKAKISVPKEFKDIPLRKGTLKDISGVPYEKALEFEYMGTLHDAFAKRIPVCVVTVDEINEFTAGELIGFWQYVAVYSSLLREVNPYDQPQVEASKEISFKMRKEYKK